MTPADLDANPMFAKVLKIIPLDWHILREHFRNPDKNRVNRSLTCAFSSGILKRISPYDLPLKMESVKFWCTQLNAPGHRHAASEYGARQMYLRAVAKLDEWLPGKSFQSYESIIRDGQITRQAVTESFATVEELLYNCTESDHGTKTAQRAIREYLTSPQAGKMSDIVHSITRAAIKSYFGINDAVLDLPKIRKKHSEPVQDDDLMTLEDFYNMLKDGNPGIKMKTIMLIKLQSGMDSSTFAG